MPFSIVSITHYKGFVNSFFDICQVNIAQNVCGFAVGFWVFCTKGVEVYIYAKNLEYCINIQNSARCESKRAVQNLLCILHKQKERVGCPTLVYLYILAV